MLLIFNTVSLVQTFSIRSVNTYYCEFTRAANFQYSMFNTNHFYSMSSCQLLIVTEFIIIMCFPYFGFSPISQKLCPITKNGIQIRILHQKIHNIKGEKVNSNSIYGLFCLCINERFASLLLLNIPSIQVPCNLENCRVMHESSFGTAI